MRPSQAKTGGGFLNNVEALFTGYSFVVAADTAIKNGKNKGKTWSPISFIPTFRVDGADEDVSQRLLVGNLDNLDVEISEDGQTLTFGEGAGLFKDNETMIFFESLISGGFPEDAFDEDPQVLNFAPAVGARVRLIQEVNAEKTKNQGKQKGKDGKEYDRRDLKVQTVIALPSAKGATKGAKAPAATKAGKASKGVDVKAVADETLLEILGSAKDGTLAKKALKMKAFAALGKANPNHASRDAVTKLFADDDYLSGVDGVDFDGDNVSLSA